MKKSWNINQIGIKKNLFMMAFNFSRMLLNKFDKMLKSKKGCKIYPNHGFHKEVYSFHIYKLTSSINITDIWGDHV